MGLLLSPCATCARRSCPSTSETSHVLSVGLGWLSQKSVWSHDNCDPRLRFELANRKRLGHVGSTIFCSWVTDDLPKSIWVQNFCSAKNTSFPSHVRQGLASPHFHATSIRPGGRDDAHFASRSLEWGHVRELTHNIEHGNTRLGLCMVKVNTESLAFYQKEPGNLSWNWGMLWVVRKQPASLGAKIVPECSSRMFSRWFWNQFHFFPNLQCFGSNPKHFSRFGFHGCEPVCGRCCCWENSQKRWEYHQVIDCPWFWGRIVM